MSTIISANVSDGTLSIPTTFVTNGSAKMWARVNGAATPTLGDTFNVSSLVDSGVGIYDINLTNAMSGTAGFVSGNNLQAGINTAGLYQSASQVRLVNRQSSDGTSAFDGNSAISTMGDLA
jgi:hypothetical protein